MTRVWGVIRYSSIGVFFAGIVSFIQGCSQNDINFAFLLWLIMMLLGGGAGEEASTDPGPTVPTVTEVVLFSAGQPANQGNLLLAGGGVTARESADNLCIAAKAAHGVTHTNVRAFISIDANDEIQDMIKDPPDGYGVPTNRQVQGPTGIKIADVWADLFDHSVDPLHKSLRAAGVTTEHFWTGWWSGSDATGAVSANACGGWTTNAPMAQAGQIGFETGVDAGWISSSTLGCGHPGPELICIGF